MPTDRDIQWVGHNGNKNKFTFFTFFSTFSGTIPGALEALRIAFPLFISSLGPRLAFNTVELGTGA